MGSTGMTVYGSVPNLGALIDTMGESIAKSRLAGCENIDQGKVLAMTCIVRNCDPLTLLETYDIIQGRLSMKADAMLAGFESVDGKYRIIQYSPEASEIEFERNGSKLTINISWEDAQKEKWPYGKGNKIKDNWSTPIGRQDMLWARVVSRGVRRLAPSVVCGRYTPEEIQDFNESPVAHTGTAPPDVVASPPQATTPADSSGGNSKVVQDEIVDAEFEVQSKESDDRMVVQLNDPSTPDQKKTIIELMGRLKQDGVSDIADRVKAKLAESSIEGGLLGLTVSEADALIKALRTKETKVWFEAVIVGHEKANSGNG
ncbi:hypothetical protein [Roseiconus lacunae]|uniref:hypothetical protein n=1 Tax=Roseiconus lacunae TaxID=2605694 RepID=UPI001E4A1265|nr:hypothetical protein [Roseiconus lacunae]MCD0459145.1 hypothetical protein [Roseiconus lacunae]